MSLTKYNQKRDFNKTKEPKSNNTKESKNKLSFVIQRHHASHLHYDFRLELDGVLKSWAIPKGPSLNPNDKRLAMMVEDHPYDYKGFEGEIPKGNYGAGTVYIFDEGEYQSLAKYRKDDEATLRKGLKDGNLKFKLKGKKLKGEFALVKIKNDDQNSWLLIKHRDEFATDKQFEIEKLIPKTVIKEGKDFKNKKELKHPVSKQKSLPSYSPMLAKLTKHSFIDKNWLFERKWDGYRILIYKDSAIKLESRRGKDYTDKYPRIAEELEQINEQVVLDAEIVVYDSEGKDKFQLLQDYDSNSSLDIRCFVFDILFLNGHDITNLPLIQRKELLQKLWTKYKFDNVFLNEYITAEGEKYFEKGKKEGWEGIMAKNSDSEYYSGKRSDAWLKIKTVQGQEAIILGYTKPEGSRQYFGALVLGINEGKQLKYIGNCGTGFNDASLKKLYNLMSEYKTDKKTIKQKVNKEKSVQWIKPEIICEISFTEWTKDGRARHPVFKGLRDDKETEEISKEEPIEEIKAVEKSNENTKKIDGKSLKLTNLNKIYWPNEHITKGQMIDYYETMSDFILPYLKDKPMSLNRFPNGINQPGFYQKNVEPNQIPSWIKTVDLYSESTDKEVNYLVCNNTATLVFIANLGCIELNPWLSSYRQPENPDFIVIDLDPDGNPFKEVVQVALATKEILDQMKIEAFVKTSGSTGIHIYIHTGKKYTYDLCKQFAEFLATKVHEALPKLTSVERSVKYRKGKIYIDYLQNRRGQTVASPYSVRPKPNATVSFPLEWDELDKVKISDFNIFNVPDLVKNRKDPWLNITKKKQDLKSGLKILLDTRS